MIFYVVFHREYNFCYDVERNAWLQHKYLTISELCPSANNTVTQNLLSSILPLTTNHLTPCQASWMTLMSVSSRKGSSNNKTHIQPHCNLVSKVQTQVTWPPPMVHGGHLYHVTGVNDHVPWLSSHQWAQHLGVATDLKLKDGPPPQSVDLGTLHRRFVLILEYQLNNVTWSLRKAR